MEDIGKNFLEWGVAAKALSGNPESGDQYVYQVFPQGALIAVVDGVGHGSLAAAAAREACQVLQSNPGEGVIALARRCHEKLRGTRGVALSLASFSFVEGSLAWLGIGNVRGILLPAGDPWDGREESVFQCPGIVGSHLSRLRASVLTLSPWDTVIFASDGIEDHFDRGLARRQHPQKAAQHIMEQHWRRSDDALILIARYKGAKI
jgi:negative regulator of sigma-B (phosphoserine phosphatase)